VLADEHYSAYTLYSYFGGDLHTMNELDDAVPDKRQCEYSVLKVFRFDWDIWLANLFRKRKTVNVEGPSSIEETKEL
jgi:hypothetical protein